MDASTEELAKKGQQSLLLLNELSQHATLLGNLGHIYNKRYFHKGGYREGPETGYEWVMRCFKRPRYVYKMFRMSPDIHWDMDWDTFFFQVTKMPIFITKK